MITHERLPMVYKGKVVNYQYQDIMTCDTCKKFQEIKSAALDDYIADFVGWFRIKRAYHPLPDQTALEQLDFCSAECLVDHFTGSQAGKLKESACVKSTAAV